MGEVDGTYKGGLIMKTHELANSLFEVKRYRTFNVTKETLIKIIEQIGK